MNYKFKNHKILSKAEEVKIFLRLKETNDENERISIRQYIIEHNLKFVARIAFTYRKKYFQMPVDDLISIGIIGLNEAIDRFDPLLDKKFITHAVFWVKQAINSSMQNNEGAVRFPYHYHNKLREDKKKADLSGSMYDQELSNAINTMIGGTSIDMDINGNSDLKLSNMLSDDAPDPYELCQRKDIMIKLKKALSRLSEEERRIIEASYGINRQKQKRKDISDDLGITIEGIRLKRNVAIEKLKSDSALKRHLMFMC